MAGKVSVKTSTIIFLLCTLVLALCACVVPVDIQAFLEDEDVQKVIDSTKIAVRVEDLTGDGLVGRKGRIEGLKNKYYLVDKETNPEGVSINQTDYPMFVTERPPLTPGQLTGNFSYITKIKEGKIVVLTDLHTYTVRAASTFPNSSTTFRYTDNGIGGDPNQSVAVNSGVITIPKLSGNGELFLNITGGLLTPANNYEIMAVSDTGSIPKWDTSSGGSPGSPASIADLGSAWTAIPLEGPGTTVDYVIINKANPADFKVLTVKTPTTITTKAIPGVTAPVTGATAVTTINATQYTGTVSWSPALPVSGKFVGDTDYTATITLTPKSNYTLQGVAANSFTVAGTSPPATNPANSGVITAIFPRTAIVNDIITIKITFEINDKAVESLDSSASIAIGLFDGNNTATLKITAESPISGINWYHDGTDLGVSLATFSFSNNLAGIDYLILGKHIFTVTATIDGELYSASFELVVTEN